MGIAWDLIKDKIKKNDDERKSSAIFDIIHQKVAADAEASGQTSEQINDLSKKFDKLSKVGFSPDEATNIGKLISPDLFKSDIAKAIQEQTLNQKQQMNSMTNLPPDLTSLGKDATPEEKSLFLDKLNPELAQTVQGISDYSLDPTKLASMRTGERVAVLAATKMFDPTFDMKKYPAQQDYIKQLSRTENGTIGNKVNSANTLISHLDLLNNQVDKLKNTNLKPANAIINLAKDISGDASITDFKQSKAVVDSELEVLLTNVGATQQGLEARRTLLSENAGYEQMKSAIKTIGHILQARTHPLEQQYIQLFGKEPGDIILHNDSKATLNRIYSNKPSSEKKSYSSLWS